jgi:hypothetical protein
MARARLLLALIVAGSFAVACGTSGYQYVENEDFGVFAKIPDSWAMYDEQDLLRADDAGATDEDMEQASERMWFRGFDSSGDPSLDGVFDLAASEPRGFVRIQLLTVSQREQVNLTSLRGFDPISVMTGQSEQQITVLADEPAAFEGYHGVHTVYRSADQEGDVAVIDQTAVLDSTSSILYVFVVGCSPECYEETHHDEIQDIVDSWTIQEGT